MNISNKEKLSNNYYISIFDNNENNELYSTQDTPFDDILNNMPYTINFTVYSTDKMENIPISFILKEGDNILGNIDLSLDNQKTFYEISDSFALKNSKIPDTSFYLKLILENINEL